MTPSTPDTADYHRRLRAAGIDPDGPPPANIDDVRNELARRISMFVNAWHGCPQRLCRRQRGCMAPAILCSNAPPTEMSDAEWDRVRIAVRRALSARLREPGLMDGNGRMVEDIDQA